MQKKKNILFYFYETQGLGHLSHFRFLYNSLKQDYNILVLCHKNQSVDFLKGMNVYMLPDTGFSDRKYITERILIIEEKLLEFSPDIFLIDFFPFGKIQLRYEIDTIIQFVKQKQGKVYTFMRDMFYGQAFFTPESYQEFYQEFEKKHKINIVEMLSSNHDTILQHLSSGVKNRAFRANIFLEYFLTKNLIDGIIVFGDKQKHRLEEESILPDALRKNFFYFGYLAEKIGIKEFSQDTDKKIVVSTGGGLTSEKQFLKLLSMLSHIPNITVDIFIGDFVRSEFSDLIKNHFKELEFFQFRDFVPKFSHRLKEYDIFFGCGGYGTFIDILETSIPAYIIPNYDNGIFYSRKLEQENRVKLFQDSMNIYLLGEYQIGDIIHSIFKQYHLKKPRLQLADKTECLGFFENI